MFIDPKLAQELHPTKNKSIDVDSLTPSSKRKVWWQDEYGHEWEAAVGNRTRGSKCPYCSGNKILAGFNDLASVNPLQAKEWHPNKNLLTAQQISSNSGKKAWWQCEKGHEWEESPNTRMSMKTNCPYCSGKRAIPGKTDLGTTNSSLAKEVHPSKNGVLKVEQLSPNSSKKIWWLGADCGHEWEAVISSRNRGHGCPYCARKKTVSGATDFATMYPHFLAQWDYEKNVGFDPTKLSPFNKEQFWWNCPQGHSYQTSICSRVQSIDCAYCANKKVLGKFNDLAHLYPDLLSEWDYEENSPLVPGDVLAGSNSKVAWRCENGHTWKAQVVSRTKGHGCPRCSSQVSKAEEEIKTHIESLGFIVEVGNRSVLQGKELDIYIPEKQIAIEFNGLYWHSEEAGKDKAYHYTKWYMCEKLGIQLIQIWEDDWNRDKTIILKSISHKLNADNSVKIMARKTEVCILSTQEAQMFFNKNHIQGYASGSYYLGLKLKSTKELVAAITLKKESNGDVLNIIRYATSDNVVGGFTKLITYAERNYSFKKFVTFSDHCISNGKLYENNDFVVDKEIAPDYMYIIKHERKHKFGYRLKRFKNDPGLIWEEGLTERELAKLNNLPRIWDAGKTRWVKTIVKL